MIKISYKYIVNKGNILLLFLLIIISCSNNKDIPKDIIPEEKMQEVLIDVFLAETYVQDQLLPQDTSKLIAKGLYDKVLSSHKISKDVYNKSIMYYTRHPDLYAKVLQPVIDSLSALEARN